MDVHVSVGEWINTLCQRMASAQDGDCFYLPTDMHLHAFLLAKEHWFPERNFKVAMDETQKV
jgi:hypothetical protein